MAKEKNSFLLYTELIETIEEITNEQAGVLFKHILRYVNDQNPKAPDDLTRLLFIPIKQNLKRDLQKWESIRQRNSANARKRWNATASERIPKNTKNAVNVNANVNVNEINTLDEFDLKMKQKYGQ